MWWDGCYGTVLFVYPIDENFMSATNKGIIWLEWGRDRVKYRRRGKGLISCYVNRWTCEPPPPQDVWAEVTAVSARLRVCVRGGGVALHAVASQADRLGWTEGHLRLWGTSSPVKLVPEISPLFLPLNNPVSLLLSLSSSLTQPLPSKPGRIFDICFTQNVSPIFRYTVQIHMSYQTDTPPRFSSVSG